MTWLWFSSLIYTQWVNLGDICCFVAAWLDDPRPDQGPAQSPAHSPQLGSSVTFLLVDAFSVFVTDKNNSLLSADTTAPHQTPRHSRSVGKS